MTAIGRRLAPLYVTAFLHGVVFWYAIEKLFMRSIGFDPATIGLATALFYMVVLATETPSGILSDRWSRKGVLVIASIALALSSLVGGLSTGKPMYIAALCIWGVFFALSTGIFESLVYDTLLEEVGSAKKFETYYGRIRILEGVGNIVGSLIGGVLAGIFGLRFPYLVTIPLSLIALVALIRFREPTLHKSDDMTKIIPHIQETLRATYRTKGVFWIVLSLVFLAIGARTLFEFNQLWFMALAVPIFLYGPATALAQGGYAVSGLIASRVKDSKKLKILVICILALAVCALTIRSGAVVMISIPLALAGFFTLSVFLSHDLHDTLPSKIRSGSASAVSTMGQILFIPISLAFGWASNEHSVFRAALIVLFIALFAVLSYGRTIMHTRKRPT